MYINVAVGTKCVDSGDPNLTEGPGRKRKVKESHPVPDQSYFAV
jgi:hypothetical protein